MEKKITIPKSTTAQRTLMWIGYTQQNGDKLEVPRKGKEAQNFENFLRWLDLYQNRTFGSKRAALESLGLLMETTDAAKKTKAGFYVYYGIMTGIIKEL